MDDADPDLMVTDLVQNAVSADVNAEHVGAAECSAWARVVAEVVNRAEDLPDTVGVRLGEALCLGEGLRFPDDLVRHASSSPKMRR